MSENQISQEVLDIINKSIDNRIHETLEKLTVRLSEEQEKEFLETLVSLSLGRLVQIGTQVGTQVGVETFEKKVEESIKERFLRRLHNTKLLLREYRKLKMHVTDSVYKKANTADAIEILEQIDKFDYNDELYIESIKKSVDRTAIIITHVEKMLEIYRTLCDKYEGRFSEYSPRKWKVIYHYYISLDEEKNINELCEELFCGRTCIYNDIDDAARSLTSLIFGIDGLTLKNKTVWKK